MNPDRRRSGFTWLNRSRLLVSASRKVNSQNVHLDQREQERREALPALGESVTLWSDNVEYGSPSGSCQGRRDGDWVLSTTQLTRQGCDRKRRSALSGRHGYRLRYTRFSRVTTG